MSVVEVLGTAFLASAVLVYVVVIAMCRAAGRADHAQAGARLDGASEVIIDLDGAARGITPSVGVRVPPIPTPRNGVPAVPSMRLDPRAPRRDP